MFRTLPSIAVFSATIALGLWSPISGALGESPSLLETQARYVPIQSITYEFGSKLMTGYFVEQRGACMVTLMIIERSDPEEPLGLTPMRVRLALSPGQIAGLDSEEGRSLNFTCEQGGTTLLVDIGDRDKLVALQDTVLRKSIAQQP